MIDRYSIMKTPMINAGRGLTLPPPFDVDLDTAEFPAAPA